MRSKDVIKIRERTKVLEQEFAGALFQLGNRLGDGIPAENAFGKVAELMPDTTSGNFFSVVSNNIKRRGMNIKEAIFDEKVGAMSIFPSNLIESAMKVLIESSKKGPRIASQAMINVSEYIKEIHRVDERLNDLMADIIADMKQQISFLTPAIAGIVVGITSMIITILGKLGSNLKNIGGGGASGLGIGGTNLSMFGDSVPAYFFQVIVGLYVVEIVYLLTIVTNGIENGEDKLSERYNLGVNLTKSTLTYVLIAATVTFIFNVVSVALLKGTAGVG